MAAFAGERTRRACPAGRDAQESPRDAGAPLFETVCNHLETQGAQSSFSGSTRNGVTTYSYGYWGGSFEMELIQAYALPNVPPGTAISRWLIDAFVNERKAVYGG